MENENLEAVDSINLLTIKKLKEEAKIALFNALGPDHYAVAEANYDLAECYSDVEDFELAHPLYLEAERVVAANAKLDPSFLYDIRVALANSYFRIGDFEKALSLSLELLEDKEQGDAPSLMLLRSIIADCYEQFGDVKNEIKVRKELILLFKFFLGPLSDEYLEEVIRLVSVYEADGQIKKAISELNKLLKLYPFNDDPRTYIDLMITKLFIYRNDEVNLAKTEAQIYKALDKFEPIDEEDEMLLEVYKSIVPDIVANINNEDLPEEE